MKAVKSLSTALGLGSGLVVAARWLTACTGSGASSASGKTSPAAAKSSAGHGPSDAQIQQRSGRPVTFTPPGDKVLDKRRVILQSALGVDLTHNSVTMPLHKGEFHGKTVWYILTESSDFGLAHDLNVNSSPKPANMDIGCPVCVQDVTLTGPAKNAFGEAVPLPGCARFLAHPQARPRPHLGRCFPPAMAAPGAVASSLYSPFIE
ncbi:MAG: hypothetical protein M3070_12270 [Actinomycetota bacterium]|nr:hypothetical protein [Actinomycetota bacterium]